MSRRTVLLSIFATLVISTLAIAPIAAYRWDIHRNGRTYRDAVIADIEATDPNWRWEDIEASRPTVPDSANAALVLARLNTLIGNGNRFIPTRPRGGVVIDPKNPPNRLLDEEAYRLIAMPLQGLEEKGPALISDLARCPHGRRTVVLGATPIDSKVSDGQSLYNFLPYLDFESERLLGENRQASYALLVHAILNVSRIEGDVPMGYGRSWSLRLVRRAARQLERGLAMGLRPDDLPPLQDDFRRAADADHFRDDIRELRAGSDAVFRAFESGAWSLRDHLKDVGPPGLQDTYRAWRYRPHLPADWGAALEVATSAIALADHPENEWMAIWAGIPKPPRDERHPFSTDCVFSIERILHETMVARALSRCAVAAIAAERNRLLTGTWPDSLKAIPTSILSQVPADPATGSPQQMARRPDGITIYSVGADGLDDGGTPARDDIWYPTTKGDIAFRLYNLDQRRLPGQPPKDGNGE